MCARRGFEHTACARPSGAALGAARHQIRAGGWPERTAKDLAPCQGFRLLLLSWTRGVAAIDIVAVCVHCRRSDDIGGERRLQRHAVGTLPEGLAMHWNMPNTPDMRADTTARMVMEEINAAAS